MIDWSKTIELAHDLGLDGFDEVVELFLEEVEDAINLLPMASDLEAALHFIKGCAMNLGFRDLGQACAAGESLANQGKNDLVDIADITRIFIESRQIFLAERHSRIAA
jgi:HPt (histidine-containing phosphotransfer) domain-containing protein